MIFLRAIYFLKLLQICDLPSTLSEATVPELRDSLPVSCGWTVKVFVSNDILGLAELVKHDNDEYVISLKVSDLTCLTIFNSFNDWWRCVNQNSFEVTDAASLPPVYSHLG